MKYQEKDLLIGTCPHNKGEMMVVIEVIRTGYRVAYQDEPWKRAAVTSLDDYKKVGTACVNCGEEGCDDSCLFVEGRDMQAVCEYASTCDGCFELTLHEEMAMDPETQLGYCEDCQKKMKDKGYSLVY